MSLKYYSDLVLTGPKSIAAFLLLSKDTAIVEITLLFTFISGRQNLVLNQVMLSCSIVAFTKLVLDALEVGMSRNILPVATH